MSQNRLVAPEFQCDPCFLERTEWAEDYPLGECLHAPSRRHRPSPREAHEVNRLAILSLFGKVAQLGRRVRELEAREQPLVVPINTFAPEPYIPAEKAILAVVTRVEKGYVASVHDVNVGASGDTVLEAIENLKEVLVFTLEDLGEEPPGQLSKRAASQLCALQAIMRRAD